jgi:hypothetical protein
MPRTGVALQAPVNSTGCSPVPVCCCALQVYDKQPGDISPRTAEMRADLGNGEWREHKPCLLLPLSRVLLHQAFFITPNCDTLRPLRHLQVELQLTSVHICWPPTELNLAACGCYNHGLICSGGSVDPCVCLAACSCHQPVPAAGL